jgi:hypothetical protein
VVQAGLPGRIAGLAGETPVVEQVEWKASPSPPGRRLAEILFRGIEAQAETQTETPGLGPQLERVRDQVNRLEALIRGLGVPPGDVTAELPEPVTAPGRGSHLLFLPANGGYALREADGEWPAPGDRLEGLVVIRLGASPLPDDRRVCVFLEPDRSRSVVPGS